MTAMPPADRDPVFTASLAAGPRLSPARVAAVEAGVLVLDLRGEMVRAVPALAPVYDPVPGDEVLAIGDGAAWYVVGVLRATGPLTLTAPGDLRLLAPSGSVEIAAAGEVAVRAPVVRTLAERLETLTDTLLEDCRSVRRWARELWDLRAGRIRTLAEETHRLDARRVAIHAAGDVKVTGEKVNLG